MGSRFEKSERPNTQEEKDEIVAFLLGMAEGYLAKKAGYSLGDTVQIAYEATDLARAAIQNDAAELQRVRAVNEALARARESRRLVLVLARYAQEGA